MKRELAIVISGRFPQLFFSGQRLLLKQIRNVFFLVRIGYATIHPENEPIYTLARYTRVFTYYGRGRSRACRNKVIDQLFMIADAQ